MLCNKCYAFKSSKEGVLFRDGAYWCEEHYDRVFLEPERERKLRIEKADKNLDKLEDLLHRIATSNATEEDKDELMKYKDETHSVNGFRFRGLRLE